jgi:hypothetical protein
LVIDDPHHVAEAESEAFRIAVLDWHDTVWSTRADDPVTTTRVVVGQRVHSKDLIAHLFEQGDGNCSPCRWSSSPPGGALHRSAGRIRGRRRASCCGRPDSVRARSPTRSMLGSYAYSSQYQQRPAPAGSGLVKRQWFRFYEEKPVDLTGHMLSLDCAFKETATSDYV